MSEWGGLETPGVLRRGRKSNKEAESEFPPSVRVPNVAQASSILPGNSYASKRFN